MFDKTVKVFTLLGVLAAVCGLYLTNSNLDLLHEQMHQNEKHLKWQNYNHLNERYSRLMLSISDVIKDNKHFSDTDVNERWVIRQYFDLTSEEYWLHQNKLIPDVMWEERIVDGIKINISNVIVSDGFNYWVSKGAFVHPKGFIKKISDFQKGIEHSN